MTSVLNTTEPDNPEEAKMDIAMGDAFRANAMLVSLTIRRFPLEVADRIASEAAESAGNTVRGAIKSVKNRLHTADTAWRKVSHELSKAYTDHRAATTEWGVDNPARLLPNAAWQTYVVAIGDAQRRITKARDAFVASYDADVATAQMALGSYAPSRYPDAQTAGKSFQLTVDFSPIAAGSDPKGLPEGATEWLSDRYTSKTAGNASVAMDSVLQRVRDYTALLIRNINEEKQFRTSSLENITGLVPMLRAFSFTEDDRFEELACSIEDRIGSYNLKTLKRDGKQAIPHVQAILDTMDAWDG